MDFVCSFGWIGYVILCVLWGVFAVRMQSKLEYPKRWYNKTWMVFLLNALFCPIPMVLAIRLVPTEKIKQEIQKVEGPKVLWEDGYDAWVSFRTKVVNAYADGKISHDEMVEILGDRQNVGRGDFFVGKK